MTHRQMRSTHAEKPSAPLVAYTEVRATGSGWGPGSLAFTIGAW